jgi:flavin-dependent dehydrogenase
MKTLVNCVLAGVLWFLAVAESGCVATEEPPVVPAVRETHRPLPASKNSIRASARRIPIAYDVDVVVVGGSSGGVAAAVAAAEKGAKVFLAAQEPYLGADICGTYRLWLRPGETPESALGKEVFAESASAELMRNEAGQWPRIPPTPMHVKRTLDNALLDAGVDFLYGCYVTDVLTDGDGNVAGIVMANRSGRQAVKAKVVIDATARAAAARMAGAAFRPYPAGERQFRYITVGGEMQEGPGTGQTHLNGNSLSSPANEDQPGVEPLRQSYPMGFLDAKPRFRNLDAIAREPGTDIPEKSPSPSTAGGGREAFEYGINVPMEDGSFASFAEAEQLVRDKTWHPGRLDAAESPFEIPPDPVRARTALKGEWPGARLVSLDVFRPEQFERLYVLGGCADISRRAAEELLRPLELIDAGIRIGADAADLAKRIGKIGTVRVASRRINAASLGDIREDLSGLLRCGYELGFVEVGEHSVPVLGEYDVVVIGGGTGGAPAGISAARRGAKTLVVEYLHGLGGVGTMGYISKYYYGYIKGFTAEVDRGVADISSHGENTSPAWNPELKKEWYRRELRNAGGEIWFGAIGCGAYVEDGKVKGAVVATPDGRGVVLAKVVIDSTGNADIAAAAGASCVYTDGSSVAVQGAGLPPRQMGAGYTNTDWTFVDDGDVVDVWRAFVTAKSKYKDAFDLGQLIDTRERRRIVGDFTMSPMDISLARTFPDTIVISRSNFDSHGFTIHPLFMIRPPDRKGMLVSVPYRCLLPKGLDGILVTGLGVSAHRDAMPVIRMQADIQNQGYAAGLIAATAAGTDKPLREVDIKEIQRHLVEKGNLPEKVLTETDSFPLSLDRVVGAVQDVNDNYKGLEVILAQPEEAMPLIKRAYGDTANEEDKLVYAHILGMHGDGTGAETLVRAVGAAEWDKGWNYTGMGQFGMSQSHLDSLIVALGRTKSENAINPILDKVQTLDSGSEFSHSRAVALALETLADPRAAKPLAELLRKPGIMGHAFTDIDKARSETPASATDTTTRNNSLRELFLARALYRCGDYEGLGEKILKEYARDLRGHYARHAAAVLEEKPTGSPEE